MFTSILKSIRKHPFWSSLRHCPVCGSSFPPIEWLCTSCLNQLRQNFLEPSNILRLQFHFRHCRLMDWTRDNDQFIRWVIQSLKGDYPSPLFFFLANELYSRIKEIPSIINDKPFCFIPCPSKNPLIEDHGFLLSQSFKNLTNFPVKPILKNPKIEKQQKNKSFLSRKEKKFEKTSFNPLPKDHLIVFVDDVVTTGSTVKAAHKALDKPEPFMVWSLFWRRRF